MSTATCTICNKKLSDKRSLRRHKQTVHKQYKENNSFVCHECGYERSGVIEMKNHMSESISDSDPDIVSIAINFLLVTPPMCNT